MSSEMKVGFVGIVGPTNSGKSTLLNALVGQKVSIVSKRVQTTYHGVKGIRNTATAQIIFIDTPGFQTNRESVARLLNRVAEKNSREADLQVWVFDASNPTNLQQLEGLKIKMQGGPEKNICVLNKVDKIPKIRLLPVMQKIHEMGLFSDVLPISALQKDGIKQLSNLLESKMTVGTPFYPTDMVTDRPQQFLASEMIREKIYLSTLQEIPYAVRVEIEGWESEAEKKVPTIHAVIHVDADSKKAILIGKGGAKLKEIGVHARKDIETMVGKQVCLKIHVNVEAQWQRDSRKVNEYLELQ